MGPAWFSTPGKLLALLALVCSLMGAKSSLLGFAGPLPFPKKTALSGNKVEVSTISGWSGFSSMLPFSGRRETNYASFFTKVHMTATAKDEEKATSGKGILGSEERLLGSRRLAAFFKVMSKGTSKEHSKLLGSRKLSAVTDIFMKTPKDKSRMLGSKRLRKAREVLFSGVTGDECKAKMFGSRRLGMAKQILTKGVKEIEEVVEVRTASPVVSTVASPKEVDSNISPAAVPTAKPVVSSTAQQLQFAGIVATQEQKEEVKQIRQKISEISATEKETMSVWVDELLDVDIYRYVLQFKNKAFEKIKATAVFRKENSIDNILSTDASKFEQYFEPGKEEIVYLAPDKAGRPILLYRAANHFPNVQDPVEYTRYILYQTEKTRLRNQLGIERQACVIVDRVGSGLKNQDPALLKVLLPTVLNHYPMYIGDVYIAPISTVFYIVWKLIQLILDEATKKRFHLLQGDYTTQLMNIVGKDSLPTTLGGALDVADFAAKMYTLDKADVQLAVLEEHLEAMAGGTPERALTFGNKAGTEEEILAIAELRVNIASLTAEDKSEGGDWLMGLENVDLLRFLRAHGTPDMTWQALKTTAKWRQENGINTILDEDLSGTFEKGCQEIYMLPPDKFGRPVVVYRSGIHFPGKVDNKAFTRFAVQLIEYGRKNYGLGVTTQACVIVDRVGSGLKNQDIALLGDLLPVFQTHYPQAVGSVLIAPINMVFYIIWQLASLLLDEDIKSKIVLVRGDIKSELLKTIPSDVLPKNLGGERIVPEAGVI